MRRREAPRRAARRAAGARPARVRARGGAPLSDRRRAGTTGGRRPFLLSTFGLISAGKGLETAIEALPAIVERHPEVLYMIAGRTHPDVARREGERYRLTLEQAVLDLGLEDHVEFDDRFLSDRRDRRSARRDRRLRHAVPRPRADLLRRAHLRARRRLRRRLDARTGTRRTCSPRAPGTIVPFADPPRSPRPSAATSSEPERAGRGRAEARRSARSSPGRRSPRRRRRCCARPSSSRRAPAAARRLEPQLVDLRTDHLLTLADDVGIIQHANGVIPNRDSGYCVDDVARLAIVALELARRGDEQVWTSIVYRSLAFLQTPPTRRRACATSWATTAAGSTSRTSATTSAARSGRSARSSRPPGCRPSSARRGGCSTRSSASLAAELVAAHRRLRRARPRAPRPDRLDPAARALLERVLEQLAAAYERDTPSHDWRWFEDALTYDNARLPHALIVGGAALGREDADRAGSPRSAGSATSRGLADGMLRLTGPSAAASAAEPAPGDGDEQPLDASAFVEAELAAFAVTGDPEHGGARRRAFDWFLGRNRLAPPAVRLRDRRLQRRPRRRDDERQRGRRVDARLPPCGAAARRRRPAGRAPSARTASAVACVTRRASCSPGIRPIRS